jgi:hypothetical protein
MRGKLEINESHLAKLAEEVRKDWDRKREPGVGA